MLASYTIYAFFLNLLYLAVALGVIEGVLRYLNWTTGVRFSDHVLACIKTNPMALAIYFGLRFIGVAYLAASLVR